MTELLFLVIGLAVGIVVAPVFPASQRLADRVRAWLRFRR